MVKILNAREINFSVGFGLDLINARQSTIIFRHWKGFPFILIFTHKSQKF